MADFTYPKIFPTLEENAQALEVWLGANVHSASETASLVDLDDLADVAAPAPTDGQVLTWNAAASRWIATAATGGGGGTTTTTAEVWHRMVLMGG
jgi:hypothetical protein